jgi:effector-binding domain-containing protein
MTYEFATRELAEQPIVSIRERHAQAEIPGFLGRAIAELFETLRLLGARPAGPPFVIYHAFGPDDVDAEVCEPVVDAISATGRIRARILPAVTVARTLHVGPYENLGAAYDALTEWIRRSGLEPAGPVQERYLNGPGDQVSPDAYETEIEIPITRALVAAG